MRYVLTSVFLLLLAACPVFGATYVVNPEGTGDFPTIQAAINATAAGDTVELTNGTFTGDGNRDIDYLGKAITVRSQAGDPDSCVIDCQGSAEQQHRGFYYHSGETGDAVLDGITITNGYVIGEWPDYHGGGLMIEWDCAPTTRDCVISNCAANVGGGVFCGDHSSPTFTNCQFLSNWAEIEGGGMECWHYCPASLTRCTFTANAAAVRAGGLSCKSSSPAVVGCTFYSNAAPEAGGLWCEGSSYPVLQNTIISRSPEGEALTCLANGFGTPQPVLMCCDVYGNAGGDWIGCIAGQYGIDGNICEDPLFCDPENDDFRLHEDSPCAPFSQPNPGCDLIGAWAVGCAFHWVVNPEGTGDFPTIQEAVIAAGDGDTIELADGVFTGNGNRDIDLCGKAITIRSQSGAPRVCTIDCEGSEIDPHRGFVFQSGEGSETKLEGVTITGGVAPYPTSRGGAILCEGSSPVIENCVFAVNAAQFGGGVSCEDVSCAVFTNCIFTHNSAEHGGGMNCDFSVPTLINCTFCGNSATGTLAAGGGVECWNFASPSLENTIIAFSSSGQAVRCRATSSALLACCDLYGNAGGDWVGYVASQLESSGNFSADPCFCDPASEDYHIWNYSPCNQGSCGLIGAWPVGCWDPQGTEDRPGRSEIVNRLTLAPNAPNPFSSYTAISFGIPSALGGERATLCVFDATGCLIRTLVDGSSAAGTHRIAWDGADHGGAPLASGVYFYRLTAGKQSVKRRMLVLR